MSFYYLHFYTLEALHAFILILNYLNSLLWMYTGFTTIDINHTHEYIFATLIENPIGE